MDPRQLNSQAPASGERTRPKLERRIVAALLTLAAVVPFVRALGFGFVYDDTWIVQHNPALVSWRSLLTLWAHPYWMDAEGAQAGLYRPVQTAILAIIRHLGGGWPIWFHLYALLLHAAVTLLVWRLLTRGVRRWPAALAALWFAVHPVHVEAVANISNSAEPLVALWTLGLYFVLARIRDREVPWRQALLVGALFVAAMLSKESGAVSLAIALLAVEAWRPRNDATQAAGANASMRRSLSAFGHRWQRVAIAALTAIAMVGVARMLVLGNPVHGGASMAAVGIEHMSLGERAVSMLTLGPTVFSLLVWPRVHNPYYGPSYFPHGLTAIIAGVTAFVVLVLAVLGAVRLARPSGNASRRETRPLAAIGWTLLAFLPASNLFVATGQIVAERTLYVPSIGVAMLLAWGIDCLTSAVARTWTRRQTPPATPRMVVAVAVAAFLAVCVRFALLAQRGTGAWRSHRALSEQMIAADPRGYRGHYMLALELRRGTAIDSVAREFATAYALYSRDPQLDLDYARFLLEQQRPVEAVQVARLLMEHSRSRNDGDAIVVYLEAWGRAYGADSVLAAASRLYRAHPHPTLALYLGLAHEARAERAAALNAYREGLRLAPTDSALNARVAEFQ